MSHHLGQGFYRHAVGEADGGRIAMTALVPGDIFVDTAFLGDDLDAVSTMGIAGDGQKSAVLRHAAILLDDVPWHVQQADIGFHACLLAAAFYPQVSVKGGLQVIFRQVVHVCPTQPRERAEDEKVTYQLVTFLLERTVYELGDFLLGQKTAFRLLFGDMVGIERVTRQPAVVDGGIDDAAEGHHVRPDSVGAMVLLRAEEQLEVRDECRRKFAQGDVAHLVALSDKFRQMIIYGTVFQVAALALHLANHLGVVLVVLPEHGKQGLVVLPQSEIGVAYLLRRYITVRVAHLLISLVDADTYLVEHTVSLLCHEAASGQPPGFHVPHPFLHIQLAAELRYLAVHRDAAHHGNHSVLLRRIAL